jgi:riboflavin synthase
VQGHVDCTGQIRRNAKSGLTWDLEVGIPTSEADFVVAKGSIAVDGVSLTVNTCGAGWFKVVLVPHTAAQTHLASKGPGDRVNIETDILGKYVVGFLRRAGGHGGTGVDLDLLRKHGFDR